MRHLVFLQGAPGCGKSTFIKEAGLEPYTISTDAMRRLISPSPRCIAGEDIIDCADATSITSKAAFDMCEIAVKAKMSHKYPVIILDSTCGKRSNMKRFINLAKANGYKVAYCNFQEGLSLEEVISRNEGRPDSLKVPEGAVKAIYENVNSYTYNSDELVITPAELFNMKYVPIIDASEYDDVCFIGDVHGCWSKLIESGALEGDNVLRVFCGDYLDRGPANEAHKVFDYVISNIGKPGFIFIEGNHERHWSKFGKNADMSKQAKASELDILANSKLLPDDNREEALSKLVEEALSKMVPFAMVNADGNLWFASHGGIHPNDVHDNVRAFGLGLDTVELGFESHNRFILGDGSQALKSDYSIDFDAIANEAEKNTRSYFHVTHVHGHRNNLARLLGSFEYVLNVDLHPDDCNGSVGVVWASAHSR